MRRERRTKRQLGRMLELAAADVIREVSWEFELSPWYGGVELIIAYT